MCVSESINGVTRDGGYGEYATLLTEAVVSVPKDVDPAEYAPQLCAGVTVGRIRKTVSLEKLISSRCSTLSDSRKFCLASS